MPNLSVQKHDGSTWETCEGVSVAADNRVVQTGLTQESEGLVVPVKLVKASGGKGPWFRGRSVPEGPDGWEIGASLSTPLTARRDSRILDVVAKLDGGRICT